MDLKNQRVMPSGALCIVLHTCEFADGNAWGKKISKAALKTLSPQDFALDLFSHSLFVFCNTDRDKLKILFWDHNGFWLYYRRLERGRFRWPDQPKDQSLAITRRQLSWLLDGLSLEQRQAHAPVTARIAV